MTIVLRIALKMRLTMRQPGGDLTGLSPFYLELTAKHLGLPRDIVPGLSRAAASGAPVGTQQ
jgi:hypothetical protein